MTQEHWCFVIKCANGKTNVQSRCPIVMAENVYSFIEERICHGALDHLKKQNNPICQIFFTPGTNGRK